MITRSKINQLEGKFLRTQKGNSPIVWHDISHDGRLLDENGFIMTNHEAKIIELADREVYARGGKVFFEQSCDDPILKLHSAVTPYLQS